MKDLSLTIESEEEFSGVKKIKRQVISRSHKQKRNKRRNYGFKVSELTVIDLDDKPSPHILATPQADLTEGDLYKSNDDKKNSISTFAFDLKLDKKRLYELLATRGGEDHIDLDFRVKLLMPYKPLLRQETLSEVKLPSLNEHYKLKVKLRRRLANPVFKTDSIGNKKKKIIYRKGSKSMLGNLRISNEPDLAYAFALNLKNVKFSIREKKGGTIFHCIRVGDNLENLLASGKEDGGYYLNELAPKRHQNWQLDIDFSQMSYDHKLTKYELLIEGTKRLNGHDYIEFGPTVISQFKVDWDHQEAALMVKQKRGTQLIDITYTSQLSVRSLTYRNKELRHSKIIEGQIGNQATTDPSEGSGAGVSIRNPKMSFAISGKSPLMHGVNINDLIQLNFLHRDKPIHTSGHLLKNEPDSLIEFSAVLDQKRMAMALDPLKQNKMEVTGTLSFQYNVLHSVDGKGQESSPKMIDCIKYFKFSISQFEDEDWIVVDVGTSAHVAIERGADKKVEIIDLHKSFKEKWALDILSSGEKREVQNALFEEAGTKFLSSTTMLWPTHGTGVEDISLNLWDDMVMMSPDVPYIKAYTNNVLPYLKALIGNRELPTSFLGRLRGKEKAAAEKIETDQIVERIYSKLLRRVLEAPKETNKLTLTIPTLFSNAQIAVVKSVVIQALPNLWDEHLVLVRESDAVAWYYFHNYSSLIKKNALGSASEVKALEVNRENQDRVLVYDMGAGTIDLTLFEIKMVGKERILKMLARVGVPKAGNYLDYVLAKVVLKVMQQHSDKVGDGKRQEFEKLYSKFLQNYNDNIAEATGFKRFIKEQLKPALASREFKFTKDDALGFTQAEYLNGISPKTIISHEDYTTYLNEVTTNLINLLSRNCPDADLTVDTLMLSGRGVQIPELEKGLMKMMKKAFKSQPLVIKPDQEKLKSIVAEGAGYFARFERNKKAVAEALKIPARFGIISHLSGGVQKYTEYVSPHDKYDLNEVATSLETVTKEVPVDLIGVTKIEVVQTFETAKMVNEVMDNPEKLYTLVTRLQEFVYGIHYHSDEAEEGLLVIEVNTNGELRVELDGAMPAPVVMSSMDLERNPVYKQSMWPYI